MPANSQDNSFKFLIVEDNFAFAIKLEMHLSQWGHQVIGIVENGFDAIKKTQSECPDFIIIDINLKGNINGIETAKNLLNQNIPLIFITGMNDMEILNAVKTTNAISFLVKPFDMLSLKAVIDLYTPNLPHTITPNNTILLRKGRQLIPVEKDTIYWIESDGNYCDIHAESGRYAVRKSLKKMLEELPKDSFLQIHKQFIIRVSAIEGIFLSENNLKIGDELLPIGRKYKAELLKWLK